MTWTGLFGKQGRGAAPKPVSQVPQALISKLPPSLDSVVQRSGRPNIDQQIDHGSPSGPELGHETRRCGARVDREDVRPYEKLLGDAVNQQGAG
jgi:hypothetical protein